jgi:hypothetical protein
MSDSRERDRRNRSTFSDAPLWTTLVANTALCAGACYSGHAMFMTIKALRPSVYEPSTHAMFVAALVLSTLFTIFSRSSLQQKVSTSVVLSLGYIAVFLACQEATRALR